MDPRDQKPRDFVAIYKNLTEEVHKTRKLQMKWFQKYEGLLDEYAKLKKEMDKLCKEKQTVIETVAFVREEGKTCLPVPVTTNGDYGWIATRPKFKLEKYGAYRPMYPDPLNEIVQLSGKMPVLAAGKGFIW
ncbi:uncharacterized protein LOC108625289 [Ceratina calcarata]|uniref:Uncharacterized protein LOC108625289 n=1 Tax=Ceratina calcarata TaxID=156304 RepID=A0AAJ7IZT0_9HYME|nr:uncharacterized protein LOC108625289 [Ceratina calcarata]XP_026669708.1 uncharacterized protein LOC108625289 [Ceratina calcarata]